MTENLSPTGVILEILGELELPLLKPIVKTENACEFMISYTKEKKLTKAIIKQELENKGLVVVDIDVFREKSERYAWALVQVPEAITTEVQNGRI